MTKRTRRTKEEILRAEIEEMRRGGASEKLIRDFMMNRAAYRAGKAEPRPDTPIEEEQPAVALLVGGHPERISERRTPLATGCKHKEKKPRAP
jgi:hypothetical protein